MKKASGVTLLDILKARLSISKVFCKKPHDAWKTWMKEYGIDDWEDTAAIRDKIRIGYLFRKAESEISSIFGDQPDIFIKGRSGPATEIQPLIQGLYDFLWDVQDLDEKFEDIGLYFQVLGMGFVSSPYVTKTKKVPQMVQVPVQPEEQQEEAQENPQEEASETPDQEQQEEQTEGEAGALGQGAPAMPSQPQMVSKIVMMDVPIVDNPVAEVEDPFKLYFSPETKFGPTLDYEHCPYYFKEKLMSQDQVKALFDKYVDTTDTLKLEDKPQEYAINESVGLSNDTTSTPTISSDLKRVKVYEYYGCLPKEQAKGIKDMDGNAVEWEYDKDYHIFFTMKEELKSEECPYLTKPLFIVGSYGFANKFFKFGDAKHLMPLIQELQIYRDKLLDYTRKMVNPKVLLEETSNVDEDSLRNPNPGVFVRYTGQPPSYMEPPALGKEVSVGVDMARTDLEKTAGTFDLSNGGSQSSVKTPRGIQVYSDAADKNIERKRKKIARLIKNLIVFQFQQVALFWKPEDNKTISIIQNGTPSNEQVTAEVLQVIGGVNEMYNLDIEVESLSINQAQQKEDAVELWDRAVQHPDIFNLQELAKDLLQNAYQKRDADRYMISDEQRQQMEQAQKPQPAINLSIKADAITPVGMQLLENEGLIEQGQAQQAMASQQAIAQINNQQLLPDQPASQQPKPNPQQNGGVQ